MAEKGGVWFLKLGKRTYRDEKLKAIREETGSTDFFQIWIAFLCLAVCEKRDGSLYLSSRKHYTPRLLAGEIGFPQERIEEAIKIFQEYDMITVRHGVIWLNNWDKYQSIQTADEYKEKNAERQKRYQERRKAQKEAEEQKKLETVQPSAPSLQEPKPEAPKLNDPYSFELDADEAHAQQEKINREKSYLCDLAEGIGLPKTQFTWGQIDKLYERYGYEKTEAAITEAARQGVVKFAYIEGILRNEGKPKKKKDEEEEIETVRNPHRGEDWDGFDSGKGKLQIVGLE